MRTKWKVMVFITIFQNDDNIAQVQDKDDDGNFFRFGLQMTSQKIFALAESGAGIGAAISDTVPVVDTWHYATAVYAAVNSRAAYLDGGNKGTNTTSATPASIDSFSIGREGDSTPGDYWPGNIDEFWLLDDALSDAEVKFAYHNQKPTAGTVTLGSVELPVLAGNSIPPNFFTPPTPPQGGFQVLINGGATTATSSQVMLILAGGSNTTGMAVSNNHKFSDVYGPEAYQLSKNWNLCSDQENCPLGDYTVYAKFYTKYIQPSQVVSTTITLVEDDPLEVDAGTGGSGSGQQEETDPNEKLIMELKEEIMKLRLIIIQLAEQIIQVLQNRIQAQM